MIASPVAERLLRSLHYILDGHEPRPVADVLDWVVAFEKEDRTVARHVRKGVVLSTVFLGVDHQFGDGPPLLFETMIFGGKHDGYQERYSTWEQAELRHRQVMRKAFRGWKRILRNETRGKKRQPVSFNRRGRGGSDRTLDRRRQL